MKVTILKIFITVKKNSSSNNNRKYGMDNLFAYSYIILSNYYVESRKMRNILFKNFFKIFPCCKALPSFKSSLMLCV